VVKARWSIAARAADDYAAFGTVIPFRPMPGRQPVRGE
jgi:hypothetical protein